MLTLYWPKLLTTQVNDTSRPCVTVRLSKGARNSGSGSVVCPRPVSRDINFLTCISHYIMGWFVNYVTLFFGFLNLTKIKLRISTFKVKKFQKISKSFVPNFFSRKLKKNHKKRDVTYEPTQRLFSLVNSPFTNVITMRMWKSVLMMAFWINRTISIFSLLHVLDTNFLTRFLFLTMR